MALPDTTATAARTDAQGHGATAQAHDAWRHHVQGTIKTVTLSKEADGWYAYFSCADVPTEPLPLTGRETGIDVGLKVFLITAAGEAVANPRHYRMAERALKKAQRRVARRTKGSKRRRKAVMLLAKQHQHVRRQRSDFHHKTALALLRQYDVVYIEAIQPANLSRRPAPVPDGNGTGGYEHNGASRKAGLNKSIQDAGWGSFLSILTCKAACAGKRVEAVPPAYTTQDCSGCGKRIYKSLSVRTHFCTHCGLLLDRDENAAKNILWRGQRLRGLAGMPAGDAPRTRGAVAPAECQNPWYQPHHLGGFIQFTEDVAGVAQDADPIEAASFRTLWDAISATPLAGDGDSAVSVAPTFWSTRDDLAGWDVTCHLAHQRLSCWLTSLYSLRPGGTEMSPEQMLAENSAALSSFVAFICDLFVECGVSQAEVNYERAGVVSRFGTIGVHLAPEWWASPSEHGPYEATVDEVALANGSMLAVINPFNLFTNGPPIPLDLRP
jgi:hypothetical protein